MKDLTKQAVNIQDLSAKVGRLFLLLGAAVLNESALTGESRLVERGAGDQVRSGITNAGASFQVRAATTAAESTFAGIVRMVRERMG